MGIGGFPHSAILPILPRDLQHVACYLMRMSHLWGFDLSMSAVRLMRREAGYWREIAAEKIDGPDIEDRLNTMIAQVPDEAAVHIFLPRDQILYTDVKISSEDDATDEIDAAMTGRTPYALDELEIDWEMAGDTTARVAAIARETLDEALAFAETRGLSVAQFSSFAEPEDFPRLPDFGDRLPDEDTAPEQAAPTFTTTRETPAIATSDASTPRAASDPVVVVDDDTPVMQVEQAVSAPVPLDSPLPRKVSEPRILTDIAASEGEHERAASLTPATAKTGSGVSRKGLAIAVAATLIIGAIIWSILPDRSQDTGALPVQPDNQAIADAAPAVPADPLADAPVPDVADTAARLPEPPAASARPDLPVATAELTRTAAPTPVQPTPAADTPEIALQQLDPTPADIAEAAQLEPGLDSAGGLDRLETLDALYIAAIELPDLATDAIALPDPDGLKADAPVILRAPPAALAAPEADPPAADDTQVASIDPTATPAPETDPSPDAPELVETEPDTSAPVENIADQPLRPTPTALAAALPDTAPRARPGGFVETIEKDQFGGRTRSELATIRPPTRPQSSQALSLAARAADGTEGDAIDTSLAPRLRPENFDALVAQSLLQQQQATQTAALDFQTPDTSAAIEAALAAEDEQAAEEATRPQNSPRLAIPPPSSANVARQATIEDAIRLNRLNLVGVYGVPSDRRALVRLPSGRYVKVKVGDRVDGGTVAAISESELRYRKGSKTYALTMPSG